MTRSEKTSGPIFESLADHYIFPGAYSKATTDGVGAQAFKRKVKQHITQYINQETELGTRRLPFLRIDLSSALNDGNDWVLQFEKHLHDYMVKRRITRVVLHNEGSYILPLSLAATRRRGNLAKRGGFEISLRFETVQRMLTSFAHEVGHTYFYDLSAEQPNLILPELVLKVREWYAQFEGLAYDFGREVLLPRKTFEEYVHVNYPRPSLRHFEMMCDELKVSKEILSQRLLRDMRLWNACIFWGTVSTTSANLQHTQQSPQIIVRDRDKRKAAFPNLSLGRELASAKSELRKIILDRCEQGTQAGIHVVVAKTDFLIDIHNAYPSSGGRYFTALLYPPDTPLLQEDARGDQLSINALN